MKMRSKLVSLLLAVSLLVSTLAGCGGKDIKNAASTQQQTGSEMTKQDKGEINPTVFPIVNEPITVNGFASRDPNHIDWNEMPFYAKYKEMTKIDVKWNNPTAQGYEVAKNLILASGDIPDFFFRGVLTQADQNNYGSQGVLIPLNDLIDKYAPNILARMKENPDFRKSITQADGKIYSLPQANGSMASRTQKNWINKKWLDKLGLAMPSTTDELLTVLKAFRDKDPNGNGLKDEIANSERSKGDKLFMQLLGSWGLGNQGNSMAGDFFDLGPDGKVRFYATDPKFMNHLQYLNVMWKEGLLDKQIFTQGTAEFTAKGDQNLIGSFFQGNSQAIIGQKHTDDFVAIPALKGPYGDQQWNMILPLCDSGAFAITKKCKYPEAMIRWVDYFYGFEGSKMIRMGFEGETYHKRPDGSYIIDDIIMKSPKGLDFNRAIGQYVPGIGGGLAHFIFEDLEKVRLPESVYKGQEVLDKYLIKSIPQLTFSTAEQEQINELKTDIDKYVKEMRIKFTMGEEPFSNWDKYVNTLQKMGLEKLKKVYQASYDRWSKN